LLDNQLAESHQHFFQRRDIDRLATAHAFERSKIFVCCIIRSARVELSGGSANARPESLRPVGLLRQTATPGQLFVDDAATINS